MQARRNPILVPPRSLLGSLISFEALLVLYIFAAIYKADPRFAWFPVDPTGLFFALTMLVGSFIIVLNPIHKKSLPVVFAMLCLVAWLALGLLWSPSNVYGPEKVFFVATLELGAVIAGAMIIAPDPERLRRLFTLLLLLSLWLGIEVTLLYIEAGGQLGRIYIGSASYLMIGRACGLGAMVALVAWLYGGGRTAAWLCLASFLCLGFVLTISGGRGPLLATALSLLIPIMISVRLTTRKIVYSPTHLSVLVLLLAMITGLGLYAATTDHRLETIERLERLVEGDSGHSVLSRAAKYARTGDILADAPALGHGPGSWPLLTGSGDIQAYPHNLFAELLVESGLVGLFLFLVLLGVVLRPVSLERLRRDPQALCAMMLLANTFLNAMVSGDLPGNRAMFMMIGVLALFAVRPAGASAPAAPRSGPVRSGCQLPDAGPRRNSTRRAI